MTAQLARLDGNWSLQITPSAPQPCQLLLEWFHLNAKSTWRAGRRTIGTCYALKRAHGDILQSTCFAARPNSDSSKRQSSESHYANTIAASPLPEYPLTTTPKPVQSANMQPHGVGLYVMTMYWRVEASKCCRAPGACEIHNHLASAKGRLIKQYTSPETSTADEFPCCSFRFSSFL